MPSHGPAGRMWEKCSGRALRVARAADEPDHGKSPRAHVCLRPFVGGPTALSGEEPACLQPWFMACFSASRFRRQTVATVDNRSIQELRQQSHSLVRHGIAGSDRMLDGLDAPAAIHVLGRGLAESS